MKTYVSFFFRWCIIKKQYFHPHRSSFDWSFLQRLTNSWFQIDNLMIGSTGRLNKQSLFFLTKHLYQWSQWCSTDGRTPPINAQCRSMPLKIMALIRNWSALIGIDRHWDHMDQCQNFDRHWLALIGIGHWSRESWYIQTSHLCIYQPVKPVDLFIYIFGF